MSGGTGEIKLRLNYRRYRRLPLMACSHWYLSVEREHRNEN